MGDPRTVSPAGPIRDRHSIGSVARRTGLKPELIRAWERRYRAVEPSRTETNRRYYSSEDIRRLQLLRKAVETGRSIGDIGHLPTEALEEIAAASAPSPPAYTRRPASTAPERTTASLLTECLVAVENLDSDAFSRLLDELVTALPPQQAIISVVSPLLEEIGARWAEGRLRISHEHMASALISSFLYHLVSVAIPCENAPGLIVAAPSRQFHELGALMSSVMAASEGWIVTYLGANLPAEELAAAMRLKGCRVLLLSLVFPPDDPHLDRELARLRRMVGADQVIIAGGRAARAYGQTLNRLGIWLADSLHDLRNLLRELRSKSPSRTP